jgi:uncharacterized protein (TIGR02231 family)
VSDSTLPIVAVTLLEDRASVRRAASLPLEAGSHRFAVLGVSPVIADKTLSGKLSGAEGGKILDLRVLRRPRSSGERPDPESQALWQRIEEQREIVDRAQRSATRLATKQVQFENLATQWAQEVALDTSFSPADPERWLADWEALKQALSQASEGLAEARIHWRQQQALLDDLMAQHQQRQTPGAEIEATLELTVVMETAATVQLSVEYCVPNACWRPYHVAEWLGGSLRFSSQACLWQNTGESWEHVSLSFSTERAALGTEPPELRAELLHLQPKQKKTVVVTREETVHRVEERICAVPGIDAGGETLRYSAAQKVSVASDGRPHRVPLFDFEAPSREELVLMGELRREVFVRTQLENLAKCPILAGPVDLIKSCGLVGRGYLTYAAAGETFSVNWGPHPELRCHRQVKISADEKSHLSGWRTREHLVEVHLSNLGSETHAVEVRERVPVSELKSVKVEQNLAKTTAKIVHDKDGFLVFPTVLPPHGRTTITLAYLISRGKEVEGL